MVRSFPDSGVLIEAARGANSTAAMSAIYYLGDPERLFLTSALVQLGTVPKAKYTGRTTELAFYQAFPGFKDSMVPRLGSDDRDGR
jgi:hypothetical protein